MAPHIITPNHALKLRAKQDLIDKEGNPRCTGERWLVRDTGAYLPGVFEEVRNFVDTVVVTVNSLLIKTSEMYSCT